jgi:hypothetical protein
MPALQLYGEYSREGVHDFFDPSSPFVRGTGLWGIRGIIPLAYSPGDFALFVTFDKQEGSHVFDESVQAKAFFDGNPSRSRLLRVDEFENSSTMMRH